MDFKEVKWEGKVEVRYLEFELILNNLLDL